MNYLEKLQVVNNYQQEQSFLDKKSECCVITCSGMSFNLGKILNTNNTVKKVLKYSQKEIIGQNITKLMPLFLAEVHDEYMRKFADNFELEIPEKKVFAKNKEGYLIYMILKIKILPFIEEGIQIIGLMQEGVENTKVKFSLFLYNTKSVLHDDV